MVFAWYVRQIIDQNTLGRLLEHSSNPLWHSRINLAFSLEEKNLHIPERTFHNVWTYRSGEIKQFCWVQERRATHSIAPKLRKARSGPTERNWPYFHWLSPTNKNDRWREVSFQCLKTRVFAEKNYLHYLMGAWRCLLIAIHSSWYNVIPHILISEATCAIFWLGIRSEAPADILWV